MREKTDKADSLLETLSSLLAIQTSKLPKKCGDGALALHDVDVEVPSRTVFTLLGPNAAGKTAFLRIISTQLYPTSGSVTVIGLDLSKASGAIRKRIANRSAGPDSVDHSHSLTNKVGMNTLGRV